MVECILSIDQGTTSSRCILFDLQGNVLKVSQKEYKQYYPNSGWVEQDAMELLESVLFCMNDLSKQIDRNKYNVIGIGISNQRETTILWNRFTGKPVYKAIVWQSRQSQDECELIKESGFALDITAKTGLMIDPYFSASKIAWIFNTIPEAKIMAEKQELCFGTVDSWLIFNLTKERNHYTDPSNASRTLLYNLHTGAWDETLAHYWKIPMSILPEIKDSADHFGVIANGLPFEGVAIRGVLGDQQAALLGHNCTDPGNAKCTYGTGCFILVQTGSKIIKPERGLISTVAWSMNGKLSYAIEGSVFTAGSAIQWLRDELGMIESAEKSYSEAISVDSSNGVVFVPALSGLGAPYWDSEVRGAFLGLSRGVKKAHMIRAVLESIAMQTTILLREMERISGIRLNILRTDGGAATNPYLIGFQCDMLQRQVSVPVHTELTAL